MGSSRTAKAPPDGRTQTDVSARRAQIRPELSRVTLAKAVDSNDGLVPAGSTGTIVHVYRDGTAYEVEFTRPLHAIATVEADDIAA